MRRIFLLAVFLMGFTSMLTSSHADLHRDFSPKLSGIKTVDFDLIPQSATKQNVNRVLGIFLFAVKEGDTSFLNYIDSAPMTQGNGLFLFFNELYKFSHEARDTLVQDLGNLRFNQNGFMQQISSYLTADVNNHLSMPMTNDLRKRLSGLKGVDFVVLREIVKEDNVRKYVNMILLALTNSVDAYIRLMDYQGQFSASEIRLLLTEFRKLSGETRDNVKRSLHQMHPAKRNRIQQLHSLL